MAETLPGNSLDDLAGQISSETGKDIKRQVVWYWLNKMGIQFNLWPKKSRLKASEQKPHEEAVGQLKVEVRYREQTEPPLACMGRRSYPGDLTDEEWAFLEPILSKRDPRGRTREVDLRDVVNALRYQARTGCQWRYLPHEFPPWDLVAKYYYKWLKKGT